MGARLLNTALGVWLMAAPALLGYGAPAEINDRIVGPLVATFAIVAIAGATRPLRRGNTAAGLWLLAAPWILGYSATVAIVNNMVVGAVVLGASLVRGEVGDTFGGGWSSLWRREELHNPAEAARRNS